MSDRSAVPLTRSEHGTDGDPLRERVYRRITLALQLVLAAGVVGFLLLRDWPNALLTVLVIVLTLLPQLLRRLRIDVPPEFQLVAAAFVFCAIFLGTALGFYSRLHW